MHDRVQQGDIGIGLKLEVVRRVSRELRAPRIDENELGPALDGVFHPRCRDRMIHDRIGANE